MARLRNRKTSPRVIAQTVRVRKAIELRLAGWSLAQIAVECGWKSDAAVCIALQTALKKSLAESAEAYRAYELARLDRLMMGIWEAATAGNLECVDRVLKIMQQRLRYLAGLEVPAKIAPTSPDGQTAYDPLHHITDGYAEEVAQLVAEFGLVSLHGSVNGHARPSDDPLP